MKPTCQCHFQRTIDKISGKWNMVIIGELNRHKVLRYGELKRTLGNITHKMLSQKLKELEESNLIIRTQYNQIPPKVEYSLSVMGLSLVPILEQIDSWGKENIE